MEIDKKTFLDFCDRNSFFCNFKKQYFAVPFDTDYIHKVFAAKTEFGYYNLVIINRHRTEYKMIMFEEEFKSLTYSEDFDKLLK